jgi:hypothetical protein
MASDDRFKQSVITTIARRAANRCSNPDCGAVTSGPTDDPSKAVNVGEAAHIYGAHPGSARYNSEMLSADRGAIANAIWLCGNCHKIIDDDPNRFPAGLLFEWVKDHERKIGELVGKAGVELRLRYERRHLEDFGRLSYLSERIVTEKADAWEYRLTAEVLRFEMEPTIRRWRALKNGLYMRSVTYVAEDETLNWVRLKFDELGKIIRAFDHIANNEFAKAWGEPGTPGYDIEIVDTCRLFSEMCDSSLRWEEDVRFAKLATHHESIRDCLKGMVGMLIDEAAKFPEFISRVLNDEDRSGKQVLSLKLDFPAGSIDRLNREIGRIFPQ